MNLQNRSLAYALCAIFLSQTMSAQKPAAAKKDSAAAPSPNPHFRATYSANSYMQSEEDSSVNPAQTVITYTNGPTYHVRISEGKVVELLVNERKIPADSFYVYDNLVKKIALQLKLDKEQAQRDDLQAQRDKEHAQRDDLEAERDKQQAQQLKEQADQDQEQAQRDNQQAQREKLQATRIQIQAKKERLRDKEEQLRREEELLRAKLEAEENLLNKQQAERDQVEARMERVQAEQERADEAREQAQARAEAENDRIQAQNEHVQTDNDRVQADKDRTHAEEDRALLKKLISESIREGLVPDERRLHSLLLNKEGLFINGQRQTDAVRKKILDGVGAKSGFQINYSRDSR